MNGPWHQALGLALTGEDLALGVQERFEVNEAVAATGAPTGASDEGLRAGSLRYGP